MCVREYYLCMRSQVTLWHTFVYLWQRHHYPGPGAISSWATDFHNTTLSELSFIIYHQNNTTLFSLCSPPSPDLVWLSWCHESPGPKSQLRPIFRTRISSIYICQIENAIISQWSLEKMRETNEWRGQVWRWPGPWCEVCHCLYLPNQQSPLCHCPPPAVKMFECPHNTKLTRKWRQYTLFYTPSRTQMTLKI